MNIGYIRVSSADQNTARQEEQLNAVGMDKVFIDKASGKDFDREQYKAMSAMLRKGDVVFITSLDRLGRNYKDIAEQWDFITKTKEADIVVLDMDILDTRKSNDLTGTLISDIVVKLLSYVAEKERNNIRERQAQGIAIAKAAGKYKGRKPIEIDKDFLKTVHTQWYKNEITTAHAVKLLGLSRNTFYRRMWEYEEENGIPQKNGKRGE